VSFAAITLCVTSQRVFIFVVYIVMTQSGNLWVYPRTYKGRWWISSSSRCCCRGNGVLKQLHRTFKGPQNSFETGDEFLWLKQTVFIICSRSCCKINLIPKSSLTIFSESMCWSESRKAWLVIVRHKHARAWSVFWPTSGKTECSIRCTCHDVDKSVHYPQAVNFKPKRGWSDLPCVPAVNPSPCNFISC
jgi:hypothetical protein